MRVRDLRRKYLDFFQSHDHRQYPSGALVPYDVTGRLDESLLFNGAGMVQFKPFFRGIAQPPHPRLTTAQKCMRTGDIEEVGDASHLTFFEMLGNFSFGDYFKEQAVAMSWQFLTGSEWLNLDPERLSFTVFEDDDETFDLWAGWIRQAGLEPAHRIFRLGEQTNFWPAGSRSGGPPGPCGPNTEMFYWSHADRRPPQGAYTAEDYLRDESQGLWLEIWNDVFIQFEWQGKLRDASRPELGYEKTGMPNLPFQSVDTGMGLERTAAVLGGNSSVYDTDAFIPIIREIERVGSLGTRFLRYGDDPEKDRAIRIVADHIRAASFCLADGVLPGNTGRGYVLRRLIRRAVVKGSGVLGLDEPFFHELVKAVEDTMGDHYTEIVDRAEVIRRTLHQEEVGFRKTIQDNLPAFRREVGTTLNMVVPGLGDPVIGAEEVHFDPNRVKEALTGAPGYDPGNPETWPVVPGDAVFHMYETFGLPLELLRELAADSGLRVDEEGLQKALEEAKARSRGATGMEDVYGGVSLRFDFRVVQDNPAQPTPTRFLGYETLEADVRIAGAVADPESEQIALALDATPFYAESGGQVSDTGRIVGEDLELEVVDLIKQDGVFVHVCNVVRMPVGRDLLGLTGMIVRAIVNGERRAAIVRNHTATHLLHAALRRRLGTHVTQAGSLVSPEHLRFDFTAHEALSAEDLAVVEAEINREVLENHTVVTHENVPIERAREMGAMALFGEKYADFVRVVQIGEFSKELCGGTHVRATGEIGLIKIVSEASAARGVRRIEALTGNGAREWVNSRLATLNEAAALLKANPAELPQAVERTLEQVREERRKREKLAQQGGGGQESVVTVGNVELATQRLEDADPKDAAAVADRLVDGKPNRVALVVNVAEGKVTVTCKVGESALKAGAHAGNLVREIAKRVGGGGGGRPDFATAGGKDAAAVAGALAEAPTLLSAMLA